MMKLPERVQDFKFSIQPFKGCAIFNASSILFGGSEYGFIATSNRLLADLRMTFD